MGLGGDWLRRKVALVGQQRSMLLSRNSRTSMRVRFSCSQRLYSMASPIVLPHDEIEDIWFGGYNFTPGNPPPMEALKRWFYKDPQFDATCQHAPIPSLTKKIPTTRHKTRCPPRQRLVDPRFNTPRIAHANPPPRPIPTQLLP